MGCAAMRPLSKIHCVIPHNSLITPTPAPALTTLFGYSPHSRSSTNIFPLQHHIQTRHLHRLAPSLRPKYHPTKTFQTRTPIPAPPTSQSAPFSTTPSTMSSDDAYMSFLDKANADLNAGRTQQGTTETARTETVDANTQVPAPLKSVDAYYVSDADEPFEPVALRWEGASKGDWPSPDQFSRLISPSADLSQAISTLSPSSFDPKNQYASVLRAVRSAAVEKDSDADQSGVEVKVYRVELTSTKLEYWVLALDVPGSRVVGLRAKAFES